MNIVLLGPPGAGKGTQAKHLSDLYGLAHLSSGDLLRAEGRAGTDLGRRVAELMDAGKLVPDPLIIQVVLRRIDALSGTGGCLLDGFPRTLPQARSLDDALSGDRRPIKFALVIALPDEDIVARIVGRRSCPTCQRVFHLNFHPPAKPGVCDFDGSELIQRKDDTREVVEQRLAAYHSQTRPVENYYRERGLLHTVDGTRGIMEVFADLRRIIDAR